MQVFQDWFAANPVLGAILALAVGLLVPVVTARFPVLGGLLATVWAKLKPAAKPVVPNTAPAVPAFPLLDAILKHLNLPSGATVNDVPADVLNGLWDQINSFFDQKQAAVTEELKKLK